MALNGFFLTLLYLIQTCDAITDSLLLSLESLLDWGFLESPRSDASKAFQDQVQIRYFLGLLRTLNIRFVSVQ